MADQTRQESRATTGRMFQTRHDLPKENRAALVRVLNQRLADGLDLRTMCKQAHWNVKGENFYQLHLLFDDVLKLIEGHTDMVGERITALGGTALGTVRMAAQTTSLPEMPEDVHEGRALVEALADRFGEYSGSLRQSISEAEDRDDMATADLFTEMTRDVDKGLYFLEGHLQQTGGR